MGLCQIVMTQVIECIQFDFCGTSGSKVITFIKNRQFQKMEMFVSEEWNQILHYMKIAQGAWNFFHIVFGIPLTAYKRNQFKKPNTVAPM